MRISRFIQWHAARVFVVAAAVVGMFVCISSVANAAVRDTLRGFHFLAAPTTTATALTTSPASPIRQGDPVTLTAKVTPATAVGTVQFKDGTTNLGNPVILNNGTASGTTSTLTTGFHRLSAVFTPSDPAAFSPSTSPPVTFVVTARRS